MIFSPSLFLQILILNLLVPDKIRKQDNSQMNEIFETRLLLNRFKNFKSKMKSKKRRETGR